MTLVLTPLLTVLGPFAVLLLAGVVFAETGLLVGFFLPGDSLLYAAGLFAAAAGFHADAARTLAVGPLFRRRPPLTSIRWAGRKR